MFECDADLPFAGRMLHGIEHDKERAAHERPVRVATSQEPIR